MISEKVFNLPLSSSQKEKNEDQECEFRSFHKPLI
jgi:hypothetical protein